MSSALTLHWPWRQTRRAPDSESHREPSITSAGSCLHKGNEGDFGNVILKWSSYLYLNVPGRVISLHIKRQGLSDLKKLMFIILTVNCFLYIKVDKVRGLKRIGGHPENSGYSIKMPRPRSPKVGSFGVCLIPLNSRQTWFCITLCLCLKGPGNLSLCVCTCTR